ncbi:MAG TPA: RNase H family protein [Chloroflexota bacterium]
MSVPPVKRAFGTRDLEQFAAIMTELRAELKPPTAAGDYVAHTDGACLGNPEGPGGWAAVVEPNPEGAPWLLYGHLSSTSNNRAEALGILAALDWVPPGSRLNINSDSELSVRVLQGRYKAKANPDIWEVIRRTIADKKLTVQPEWLRGHAGDPRNELADRLTKVAAKRGRFDPALEAIDLSAAAPVVPSLASDAPPELAGLEPKGDWEHEFLRSIAKQLRGKRALSPKQQAIIDKIRARGAPSSAS